MSWLEFAAAVASIAGAGISIFVLFGVRALRRHYLARARIPQLVRTLQSQAGELSSNLSKFNERQRDAETVIAKTSATLQNLAAKVDGAERASVDRLSRSIRNSRHAHWWSRRRRLSADDAWEIYNKLQALVESLKHLERDATWRQ